uniref:ATP synthase F0 subunit 6 n=1 Tax=Camponotus japonicus TaxID=84547 RepID=UPI001EF9C98F|nr:ATP synthase F0 subunit 6 [Camponotus japonicus]UHM24984.1 ATP synthase F0 subunit 6 [Camponotus japonicus]
MMMNLFSIFDPSTSMSLSLNWLSISLIIFIFPFQFWLIPSRFIMLWNIIFKFLIKEFKIILKYSMMNLIIFISLFFFIFINNIMGLFPYIFTASSHLSFCLSLSLSMWISMMLFNIYFFFSDFFSHLTPQGTPPILMPFMVLIESISLVIRPLTLAIRLTANMIAGHLLLTLLGSSGLLINNLIIMIIMLLSQIMLFILEISVSLIQAYVFSILTTLYCSEI